MNYQDLWSRETNPRSGARFERFRKQLDTSHNGKANIEALLSGEYGRMFSEMQRVEYEYDAPTPETYALLEKHGVEEILHDDEDYYTRWAMYLPRDIARRQRCERKYPLIIVANGPDNGRFSFGLYRLAAKEGFLYMCVQNTNWQNVSATVDAAIAKYPVDPERIYIVGFSYQGYQATSCVTHVPWKYAGIVTLGNDVYRPYDSFFVPYTPGELNTFRHVGMPFFQIVGECEASNFVPLNDWAPRAHWGGHDKDGKRIVEKPDPAARPYKDPRADPAKDPTINPARRLPDGTIQNTPPSAMPSPPEGVDRHVWMLSRLNKRLELANCAPRDVERCLGYLTNADSDLHRILGFYGDREEIRSYYGCRHYMADVLNHDGLDMFRFCCIENHPHVKPVMAGELIWEYVKQFRRDAATGKITTNSYYG